MNFDKRLQQAIARGERTRDAEQQSAQRKTLTEEELRNLHSSARIDLTEHIEELLRKLVDHFPGFRFETVVDDSGWGARISRDDLNLGASRRGSEYSRLQLLVTPFSAAARVIEVVGKGTIRNRETLNRSHFQFLADFDRTRFFEVLDLWVLEFAEAFAARH